MQMRRWPTTWVLLLFLPLLQVGMVNGEEASDRQIGERFELWEPRDDVDAVIGDRTVRAYQDPLFKEMLLLYDGERCWMIDLTRKEILSPGCGAFSEEEHGLLFHKTFRMESGRVPGVEWGDAKMACVSNLSLLFRRPKFRTDKVRFWACDEWAEIRLQSQTHEE